MNVELPTEELERVFKRPLVTFALFAYNQERYVKQAIEGAFSQTYEPLEIILSDDCSTDRTFDIMREMAKAYSGPHKVVINRTPANLGLFHHVLTVAGRAAGKLLVMAAGDDVSIPTRTNEIFKLWRESNAWGIYSRFDVIDQYSQVIKEGVYSKGSQAVKTFVAGDQPTYFVHGATSAYDLELFKYLPNPKTRILAEDGILNLVLYILNRKICFCDQSLVKYRMHSQALSHSLSVDPDFGEIGCYERRVYEMSTYASNLADYIIDELAPQLSHRSNGDWRALDYGCIERFRRFHSMRSEMAGATFATRIGMFFRYRDPTAWRWLAPRLFGVRVLWLIRKCGRYFYQPEHILHHS